MGLFVVIALRRMKRRELWRVEIDKEPGKDKAELAPDDIRRVRDLLDRYRFRCFQPDAAGEK